MSAADTLRQDIIAVGSYVIVQRQKYRKLYKLPAENGGGNMLALGKERVEMSAIIGKPFWTTFKMIPTNSNKKLTNGKSYRLEEVHAAESLDDLKDLLPSGMDNRKITDDGTSQKLSTQEIMELREAGKSGREIEIYFQQDHVKIGSLRMDSLAQILSYCDVKSDGLYLLYDSGSQGLAAASLLTRIGAKTSGRLVYLHPGNMAQTTLIRAMNFSNEQINRLSTVNIYSLMRMYYQDAMESKESFGSRDASGDSSKLVDPDSPEAQIQCNDSPNLLKRKHSDATVSSMVPKKKPKWLSETQSAVDLLKSCKVEGLAILAAKEHPLNIVKGLLPFLGTSRPFVIFHAYREPLQEVYVMLKQRCDVMNIRLLSNFLRSYQVLDDRTHPDILMNDVGGYLLVGYLVN
ncbi:tRNA (adenine(58)-N(1))-methyltransferase non-catalytic subunit TRM6 isoform X2 [Cephus cinctus]|uniref:tRNA (adenine(58)-N(1))-methyltransferase non-catalytic subunit TRM6 n=1 Tax=Cephus cinctus TaxID=211228 RepID=A0AAJ7RCH4_CEPCN|nr:tRNA (adenine(58)-N(1))-methyltransferase non-catalytic subunit TRM6 isoform X2 [Cephus cinctus]